MSSNYKEIYILIPIRIAVRDGVVEKLGEPTIGICRDFYTLPDNRFESIQEAFDSLANPLGL